MTMMRSVALYFRWTFGKTRSSCFNSRNASFSWIRMGRCSNSRWETTPTSTLIRWNRSSSFGFAHLSSTAREKEQFHLGNRLYVMALQFTHSCETTRSFFRSGSALEYKVENLKPNTPYEYRIQCKCGLDGQRSEWSPVLVASTTSEPMNGETVFRAIAFPGKDQLEKLLGTL